MSDNPPPTSCPEDPLAALREAWRQAADETPPDLASHLTDSVRRDATLVEQMVQHDASVRDQRELPVSLAYYRSRVGDEFLAPRPGLVRRLLNIEKRRGRRREDALREYGSGHASVINDVWELRSEAPDERVADYSFGEYTLVQRIDTDSNNQHGEVWHAKRERPFQHVAIKIFDPKRLKDGSLFVRLTNVEGKTLAQMTHPNIVRFLEQGEIDDVHYVAMEYIPDAMDLRAYCDAHKLTINDRLRLMARVCEAVQYIHVKGAGLIHRDLKPANILVSATKPPTPETPGEPKVIDFGLAKSLDPDNPQDSRVVTRAGEPLGTYEYMAPEAILGKATTASDVYSLGAILFELLAGRRPMQHANGDTRRMAIETRPTLAWAFGRLTPKMRDQVAAERGTTARQLATLLRSRLNTLTSRALMEKPEDRYEFARDLQLDIENYLANRDFFVGDDPWLDRVRRGVRRNRVACTAALLVFLSLASGLAATTWQWREAERARSAEQTAKAETALYEASLAAAPPLYKAAALGDIETLQSLLEDPSERMWVEAPGIDGETPLYAAARTGNENAVRLLLEAGADPLACFDGSESSGDRRSALYAAAAEGHLDLIRTLLPLTPRSWSRRTLPPGRTLNWDPVVAACYKAIASEHYDIAEFLLGSDHLQHIDSRSVIEQSAAVCAAEGSVASIKWLVNDRGVRPERRWLLIAAANNNVEVLEWLIDSNPAFVDDAVLAAAVWADAGGAVDVVLHWAALNPGQLSFSDALDTAIEAGSATALARLLDHRDVLDQTRSDQEHPLLAAASVDPTGDMVRLIHGMLGGLDAQDSVGATPLLVAAGRDNLAAFRVLRHLGADVRHRDNLGRNVLHHAASSEKQARGMDDVFELWPHLVIDALGREPELLRALADEIMYSAETRDVGYRPVDLAVRYRWEAAVYALSAAGTPLTEPTRSPGDQGLLELASALTADSQLWGWLVGNGAAPGRISQTGMTPLHRAAGHKNTQMVRWLLGVHEESVDVRDQHGRSPLHCAVGVNSILVGHQWTETCEALLLARPSLINESDNAGLTPLHYAATHGYSNVAKWLVAAGADPNAVANDQQTTPLEMARTPEVIAYFRSLR